MMIESIYSLAEHLSISGLAIASPTEADNLAKRIAKRLFKDTRCGIGFYADDGGVTVAGYCEGTDADCPAHRLTYPFTAEAFDAACEEADQEGCDLWDETHGCDDCETTEVDGWKPVDPNCLSCEGSGAII